MKTGNILLCSAGRRVGLLKGFKQAIAELGIEGSVIVADANPMTPTAYVADHFELVPKLSNKHYIPNLVEICQKWHVNVLISLIDSDLLLLAEHRDVFSGIGVKLLLSSKETIEICMDKRKTYEFFVQNGIPTPNILCESEIDNLDVLDFPLFVKPWDGSGAVGTARVNSKEELIFFTRYIEHPIVQEFVVGEEFTVDAYVDFSGKTRCVIPRRRLEVRSGESSKARTEFDAMIIDQTSEILKLLPGPEGPITVQCFRQENGDLKFIEINPRFGGGYPLSLHAGADFPKWILQEILDIPISSSMDNWEKGLIMLKYDEDIIIRGEL